MRVIFRPVVWGWSIASLLAACPANADQPIVVDSTGKFVGAVISDRLIYYTVKPNADRVEIDISPGALGAKPPYIFFATKDCTGPIYLPEYGAIPPAYLDPTRADTIFYPDLTGPPVRLRSFKRDSLSDCFPNPSANAGVGGGYPVKSAGIADQKLTPPFSVKAQ